VLKIKHGLVAGLAAAAVALTGCSVPNTPATLSAPGALAGGTGSADTGDVRVAMVVHGGAGDAFWSDVKTGGEDAAAQTGVQLDYQTSDDLKQQGDFIAAAVAQQVSGLIVSIPTVEALRGPITAAKDAGIPVVVINSGATEWQDLGAVAYVGQDESVAGEAAGQAMKQAGATSMLCVNITQVIQAVDQRCESAAQSFGGPTQTVRIDPSDTAAGTAQVAATLQTDPAIDGVLSLGAGVYSQSAEGIKQAGSSAKLGTFDVNADINAGVENGSAAFAIDQQPYIQGYQSVITAALLAEKNLLIGGGTSPIASGPRVLTQANAG
jgi:simple sugar transport system substrate-binding protein